MKEGVDPPETSEREANFQKNRQFMRDVVKRVLQQRREGEGEEHIPFIDNLLQSGVPEEQVCVHVCVCAHACVHTCVCVCVHVSPKQCSQSIIYHFKTETKKLLDSWFCSVPWLLGNVSVALCLCLVVFPVC